MDSEPGNPYRSPREDGGPVASPGREARGSLIDRVLMQCVRVGLFGTSLLFFSFFTFGAIDAMRPHSIIQENPRAHPPRPYALRVAACTKWTAMALPFLGIMGFLTWSWSSQIWRWRANRLAKNSS